MNILEFAVARQMGGGGGVPINNQDKTITQNGTYTADEGFTGLGTVNVNVVSSDSDFDALINKSIAEVFSNVTRIKDYVFYKCTSLTTASFPNVTTVGENAFSECSNLKTINFPLLKTMGERCFQKCNALTDVTFPMVTKTSGYSLGYCTGLRTVNFPALPSIYSETFKSSTALETADFLVATSIGNSAFLYCSNLTALILRSETMATLSNTNAFSNTPIAAGTGYIYVPSALVESYKAESTWSTYAAQFRALEDYTVDGTTTGALDESKI